MKLDDLLKEIGEFGPYQKRVFLLAAIPSIFCAAEGLNVIFIFFFPHHRCAIPGLHNDTYTIQSEAHAALINRTIPVTDGRWDSCHLLTEDATAARDGQDGTTSDMLQSNTSQTQIPCSRWVFDHSVFESTVATDLQLVCGRKKTRAESTVVSEMGTLFGMLVCGLLADRFGRKLVFVLSAMTLLLGGIGVAFVKSLVTLNVCRFILGMAKIGTFVNGFVLGMEVVGPSSRMFAGMAVFFFWCLGAFYLCFFAYFIRNWRNLEIAVSIPAVILLSYNWLIPESPRWLMSKGKTDQAMAIFKKIAESNKTQIPPVDDAENLLEEESHVPLWHALRSRELMRRMFIVFINMFANLVGYWGIVLNITNLSGDIYVNFTISFALEMLAYVVCLYAFQHLGRKTVYITCIIAGGACCTLSIVPALLGAPSWVVVGLSMVGRFFITISLTVIYLYGAELFPTVIRASAIGFCISMSRSANVLSPYLADLGLLVGGKFRDALPLLVMGSPAILAGLMALWLPETRHTALPEQLQDLDSGLRKRSNHGSPGTGSGDDVIETSRTDQRHVINSTTSVC